MIEIYKRLARGCKSINQLNAVHILLENRLTPLEFMDLWSELTGGRSFAWSGQKVGRLFNRSSNNVRNDEIVDVVSLAGANAPNLPESWICKLHRMFAFAGKKSPEPFVRRRLRHGVWIFEGDWSRKQKTLLICFSGDMQRMMMPMPVFLQHMDARTTDIAYLRTEKHGGYRSGIRGLATDLHASIVALDGLLRLGEYRGVATLGASAGALPAILAGLRLGIDDVLSICPNDPDDVRWSEFADGKGATNLFRRFAGAGKLPDIYLVYGADSPRDAASVEAIASCIPVRGIRSVPGARHNALFPLVERGQFRDLLQSTVLA